MFEDLTKAITEFKKAKSIAIFTPEINAVDKATAIIALAKICSKKEKSFQILCPKSLRVPINNMFKKEGLEVMSILTSSDYIVSVDYSVGNIDKVICKRDEDSKKLNFVITPKDKEFNFDNVELISGGTSFDLTFSIGLNKIDDLDQNFKEIFDKTEVISITKKETEIGKYKFLINGQKSYSEVVYEFAKAYSDTVSEETLNILLQGVISKYKLLENGDNEGWIVANKFIKYGADFNKSFRSLYFSKDYDNFQLQRKVLENVRIDKTNRVIWSKVALMMDVDSSNLDVRGRILFNICEDFDIAFVIYHLDKENIKVVFESNDSQKHSALGLLKAFSGYGTKSRVVFTNKGILAEDFETKLFDAIYSLFEIRVS
jgi:hypothetical protein